jgi:hypothetical protein
LSILWCRNVAELPLDVLVTILAFLHNDHLRMARVVCKAFREASNRCVTRLSCGPNMTWRIIKRRLQVFNSVTCVDLAIHRARDALHLKRQAVLPRLCKVHLTCRRPDAIIPLLAAAPHLGKLEVEVKAESWRDDSPFRRRLALALEKCRSAVEVTLRMSILSGHSHYTEFEGIVGAPILHLITSGGMWLSGLPAGQERLAHFTRLQCLETVYVETGDHMKAVAALTRLTRLALEVEKALTLSQLTPLSQLTALQELKIAQFEARIRYGDIIFLNVQDIRLIVSPLVHLRELTFSYSCNYGWNLNDLVDVESLLLALPAVTCLVSRSWVGMASWRPGAFSSNGFAGLRKLSLALKALPEDVAQLAKVLTKLEALTFVGDCQSLLSNLPPMPRLTELKAERWDHELPHVSSNVLARFQGLQQLRLHIALDVKQWSEDVKSLAMLTGLRILHIEGPYGRSWHVSNEDLMPLTALKQLQSLELDGVSAPEADVKEFWEAMKAIRHERGFSCSVVPSYKGSRLTFVF